MFDDLLCIKTRVEVKTQHMVSKVWEIFQQNESQDESSSHSSLYKDDLIKQRLCELLSLELRMTDSILALEVREFTTCYYNRYLLINLISCAIRYYDKFLLI